jgi:hypothetical protein
MKIIPKLNEINYTIVPQKKDVDGRDMQTQAQDIGREGNFNPTKDNVFVDPDAVLENINEDTNPVSSEWLDVFDEIVYNSDQGAMKNRPFSLATRGVKITPNTIKALTSKFLSNPDYQTSGWIERAYRILKIAGIGKWGKYNTPNTEQVREEALEVTPETILALKEFVGEISKKLNDGGIEGDLKRVAHIIKLFDTSFANVGNPTQDTTSASMAGISDISLDKNVRSTEINNFLKGEIIRLMGNKNEIENPSVTNRLNDLISKYRITSQSVKQQSSDAEKKIIDLERKLKQIPIKNQGERADIEMQIDILKAQGVDTPENYEGDDLVDANLLLTYAVLINNDNLVNAAFELKNRSVNFGDKGIKGGKNIKGRFTSKLLDQLKGAAKSRGYIGLLSKLNHMRESINLKKLIMTERQAKLVSMLKEDGMISENIATDATKDLGYLCPIKHRKIKNLDKTDFCKKLKDERDSKTNVAPNITKDKHEYKSPTNRRKSLTIHKGDKVEDKEQLNNFFAKEVRRKKNNENIVFTKKELIETILKKQNET